MYKTILVALDGSKPSLVGGEIALDLAQKFDSSILAVHIYDGKIHKNRLTEMEPGLPEQYQKEEKLQHMRDTHDELIFKGFHALSKGYIEEFQQKAINRGVDIKPIHKEGRNYVQLLNIAREQNVDLITIGASGLGSNKNGSMGSTALRILRLASCDVLISRKNFAKESILVGVDGSKEADESLRKSVLWANAFKKPIQVTSVFDPFFHNQIFKTMTSALSTERQKDVGLNKQKSLHDNIIDEGLKKLYQGFLDKAVDSVTRAGIDVSCNLLKGKVYSAVIEFVKNNSVDLVVVGRFGHHREKIVHLGSNCEEITRIVQANVLVTKPPE